MLNLIQGVSLVTEQSDRWSWRSGTNCEYLVSEVHEFLMKRQGRTDEVKIFEVLWKVQALSKAIGFAWKVFLNRIQSKENIVKRGIGIQHLNSACSFCEEEIESTNHLLFGCKFSYQVWIDCYSW